MDVKSILILSLVLFSLIVYGQGNKTRFNWKKPKYKTVKAYLYGLNDNGEMAGEIIIKGELNPTVVDTVGVQLTQEQIKTVIDVVTGNNNGEDIMHAECFIPHHGIVFYDDKKTPVAYISICFYCENIYANPKTISIEKGLELIEQIIRKLGFPVFNHPTDYYNYGIKIKKENEK